MPCLPDKTLTPRSAPFLIKIHRDLKWHEGRKLFLWLVENDSTVGYFNAGRHCERVTNHAKNEREIEQYCWFAFSDQNTAFQFKLFHGAAIS
jgi:hypothetical protein